MRRNGEVQARYQEGKGQGRWLSPHRAGPRPLGLAVGDCRRRLGRGGETRSLDLKSIPGLTTANTIQHIP